MDILLSAPVIIKILTTLVAILAVYRLAKNLLIAVLAGALLFAFWIGLGIPEIASIALLKFISLDNLLLLLVISLVIALSNQMKATGLMQELVSGLGAVLPFKAAAAVLPASIGLLPMPGGAMFSAPLIDNIDKHGSIPSILKTKINYWFRHIWEYWWPLYPSILVAVNHAEVPILTFSLIQLPMSLAAVFAGWLVLLRKLKPSQGSRPARGESHILKPLFPIAVIISVFALVQIFIPGLKEISKYAPMVIAITGAIIAVQIIHPLRLNGLFKIVFSRRILQLVLIVAAIGIYGAYIETTGSDGIELMERMRLELSEFGIPVMALVILLPFISGLATGISVGFVGASFPIILSLISGQHDAVLYSTLILAYTSGFAGVLLSPVHVCLIVTNKHFGTNLIASLSHLALPVAIVLVFGFLYSRLYLYLM